MKWYYYLHTNGKLIGKNPAVVDSDPQYFDSPFVEATWKIETTDLKERHEMLNQAKALGCINTEETKMRLDRGEI